MGTLQVVDAVVSAAAAEMTTHNHHFLVDALTRCALSLCELNNQPNKR